MSKKFEYFGKYILLEKLATGGMAEVFLARKPGANGIGKFLAIKRILPQFADSEEFIDMFKDEAKIAINLNHSNIVSIHEFGVENEQFYIVMDYVNGRNLRQILNKIKKNNSKLSVDQIVYIVKEVAAGLDHAHRCLDGTTGKPLNITHRDMSPQNVMVSFEGELKVVDFGIAKAESKMETTRAGTLKGKFGYMSPEQAEGHQVDLRTDIFSLGIILWELLAQDRLFVANNEINTLKKIRDCQIPSLRKIDPNIPVELERITNKALARDRNLRYQTSAALHRDLNRFLNRQYPDFSARDFSVFVMTLFSDEILQVRKRQIEYAQIPFQEAPEEVNANAGFKFEEKSGSEETDSFISTVKETSGATFSSPNMKFEKSSTQTESISASLNPPPQSTAQTDSGVAVKALTQNLEAQPQEGQRREVLDEKKVASALKTKIKVDVSQNPYSLESDTTHDESFANFNPYTKYNASRYTANRNREITTKSSFKMFNFLIFSVVFLIGYAFAVKFFSRPLAGVISVTDPLMRPLHLFLGIEVRQTQSASTDPEETHDSKALKSEDNMPKLNLEEVALPETPRFKDVIISSSPSGAEIYLNGSNTGFITPSRIEVPAHEPFNLSIRRSGYVEYVVEDVNAGRIGTKIDANLQKAIVGYLDIDVVPPTKAKIYINNQLLEGETLPINRYVVPANTKLVIKAVDPFSGVQDLKVVTLQKNQRQNIILNLPRKNDRLPSRSQ